MSSSAAIFTIAASRSDPLGLSRYLRKSSAAPIVLLTVTASSPSFLCRLEGWCGGRRFSRMLGAKQCAQRELVTRGSYTTLADLTELSFTFIQRWVSSEAHDAAFGERIVGTGHLEKVLAALG